MLLALLGIAAVEGGGRAIMHLRYGVPGRQYGRWRGDPVLGARMGENRYDHRWWTNNFGFRDDEDVIEPKPPGSWRIIAYGGSTTLCWNLPTEQTWPRQLEILLRERTGRPSQVLNGGDILWSIGHVLARARDEIPRLRPDFVLLYTGLNEEANADLLAAEGRPMNALVREGKYGVFSTRLPQDSWLSRNSIVYKLFQSALVVPLVKKTRHLIREKWSVLRETPIDAAHPPSPPDPAVLENYLHVLRSLVDLCRENGAEPVFIVEATGLRTVGLDRMASYSRAGAAAARKMGIRVVDAQATVDRYPGGPMRLFYESGVHYSEEGAKFFAGEIWREALEPAAEASAGGWVDKPCGGGRITG